MTTDETLDDARPDEGAHPGRRAFMAGAAGLAAGATLLGSSSPAGAIGTTQPWTIPLKWMDMSTGATTAVGLGTGGVAQAYLSAFGDMAAMTVRIKLGAGATPGTGPWVIDGADMPTGYVPIEGPTDITEVGTSLWFGTGQALNFANPYQNAAHVNCSWVNFAAANGPVSGHVWAMPDKHNDGSGSVLFNFAGGCPFGVPNGEGTILYSSLVYLVNLPEPE
ncbi:MAG TPA: hypothetical protein VF228_00830 [Iamia sp.]